MPLLTAEKIPPIDVHRHMQAVYGDKCVDVCTVRLWVWHFEQEVVEASLYDKARSGRPLTATTEFQQEHVEDMIGIEVGEGYVEK
jgi:hypothetical protein